MLGTGNSKLRACSQGALSQVGKMDLSTLAMIFPAETEEAADCPIEVGEKEGTFQKRGHLSQALKDV